MKTKTYNTYSFKELDPAARKRAIEDHSRFIGETWDGEATQEDAEQCLAFAGFKLDKIYYSGFWSQGDGACFEGSWQAWDVKPDAMREHAPQDKELHRIAEQLGELATLYPHASFTVKHSGYYYHKYSTSFTVSLTDENGDELPNTGTAEDDLIELARDAMGWIYRQLEKEYEYQTAEAQVIESIEANEYEFTAEGRID